MIITIKESLSDEEHVEGYGSTTVLHLSPEGEFSLLTTLLSRSRTLRVGEAQRIETILRELGYQARVMD